MLFSTLYNLIIGDPKTDDLDNRIIKIVLLYGILIGLIQGIFDLITGLPVSHILTSMGSSIVFFVLFVLTFTPISQGLIRMIIAILLLILSFLIFIISEGFFGTFPTFLPTILFAFVVLFRKKTRILVLSAMAGVLMVVIYIHFFLPEMIQPYNSVERQIFDTISSLVTNSIFIVLAIGTVIRAYRVQHAKAKEQYENLQIQHELLKEAQSEIKSLRKIIPICAECKKVRNDEGFYESVENYFSTHTNSEFSHGLCDECEKKAIEELDKNQ